MAGGAARLALEQAGWTLSTHPANGCSSQSLANRLKPFPFLVAHPINPLGSVREGGPTWFRDPNIDIFVATERHNDASESDPEIEFIDSGFLPRMKMPRSALYPLKRMPFGELSISVPAQPEVLLDASYGSSWRTEASLANAHSDRSGRVQLAPGDYRPATPTSPVAKTLKGLLDGIDRD